MALIIQSEEWEIEPFLAKRDLTRPQTGTGCVRCKGTEIFPSMILFVTMGYNFATYPSRRVRVTLQSLCGNVHGALRVQNTFNDGRGKG